MKKLILLFSFLVAVFAVNAQTERVYTATVDTAQGNETIYVTTTSGDINVGEDFIADVYFTELGGTADGTATWEGSIDGTYFVPINDVSGVIYALPNDTLTVTDGANTAIVIKDNPFLHVRVKFAGTASDTTLATLKYKNVRLRR